MLQGLNAPMLSDASKAAVITQNVVSSAQVKNIKRFASYVNQDKTSQNAKY
jgi:hypothetical protein